MLTFYFYGERLPGGRFRLIISGLHPAERALQVAKMRRRILSKESDPRGQQTGCNHVVRPSGADSMRPPARISRLHQPEVCKPGRISKKPCISVFIARHRERPRFHKANLPSAARTDFPQSSPTEMHAAGCAIQRPDHNSWSRKRSSREHRAIPVHASGDRCQKDNG